MRSARSRFAVLLAGSLLIAASTVAMTGAGVPASAARPSVTADDGASVTSQTTVDDHMVDLEVDSPALGFTATVRLILPKDYSADPTASWPVLYLLHGCCEPEDYKSWTYYTDIEQFMQNRDVLVVMPSDGEDGCYSNWLNFGLSSQPGYETFHMVELEQILQRGYRASPTDQVVAGLSIGGYGAMEYAARYPNQFKAAASYSGVLDTILPVITQLVQAILVRELNNALSLWGDPVTNYPTWTSHNPFDEAANLRGKALFVSCGNGDAGPFDPTGTAVDPIEPSALISSEAFTAKLNLLGIPVTTDYYGAGTHSWPYWQREFYRSWPMLAAALDVPD